MPCDTRFTKSGQEPRFHENIRALKPTFGSWPLLVMWFDTAIQVYIDVSV
jgi:hypothetical protein